MSDEAKIAAEKISLLFLEAKRSGFIDALCDELSRRQLLGDPERLLTTEEAAEFLKVNKQVILACVQTGELPHYRIGKGFKFTRADLIELREKFRVENSNAKPKRK
jgi:excisionase family DNA binding protein